MHCGYVIGNANFDKILKRKLFFIENNFSSRSALKSFENCLLPNKKTTKIQLTRAHTNSNLFFLSFRGKCLRKCIFCYPPRNDIPFERISLNSLDKKLEEAAPDNNCKLILFANEPLLHPQINEILEIASQYFKQITTFGSAEMLSKKSFVTSLKKTNLTQVEIPVYSTVPKVHDLITGSEGHFKKTIKTIKNLKETKIEIFCHSIHLSLNSFHLLKDEKFITQKLKLPYAIIPLKAWKIQNRFQKLNPSKKEFLALTGIRSLVGFPLCLIENVQKKILLNNDALSDVIKIYLITYRAHENFERRGECQDCTLKDRCLGFPA
ncbi:MAG: radical SAM protein [Candidatus Omnitrophica bacterium]|nr:radical SAM protein [Candidatus Omnitrophota bacterium]